MERGLKFNLNQVTNPDFKKRLFISLIVLGILLVGFFGYFYLFSADKCNDIECYNNALKDCDKIYYLRDGENLVWRYEIIGKKDNLCTVEVVLSKVKKGNLAFQDIEGNKMVCNVEKITNQFPEDDMYQCTGLLKEKLQEYLIDKMHNYVLQNLGEIKENLKQI